jgi:hypothetical protein
MDQGRHMRFHFSKEKESPKPLCRSYLHHLSVLLSGGKKPEMLHTERMGRVQQPAIEVIREFDEALPLLSIHFNRIDK